jgi:hypothetical protein
MLTQLFLSVNPKSALFPEKPQPFPGKRAARPAGSGKPGEGEAGLSLSGR